MAAIMLHFIRVYTVFKGKNDLQTKEYNMFLKIITWQPYICTMNYPMFILSNQREESISIQRVNSFNWILKILASLCSSLGVASTRSSSVCWPIQFWSNLLQSGWFDRIFYLNHVTKSEFCFLKWKRKKKLYTDSDRQIYFCSKWGKIKLH